MPAAAISEAQARRAMLAWRRGVGALEPWFRATPFAAAHHYRGRGVSRGIDAAMPLPVERLLRALPPPEPSTLWIFDLPGPSALWLAYGLRRDLAVAPALAWNGWYDPRGVLDGREDIPLLLGLGARIARLQTPRTACLIFDSQRHLAKTCDALDNRYALGEEDAPSLEHLAAMGILRAMVWVWEALAEDMSAYVVYLRTRFRLRVYEQVGRGG